jgi:hypothetical protein
MVSCLSQNDTLSYGLLRSLSFEDTIGNMNLYDSVSHNYYTILSYSNSLLGSQGSLGYGIGLLGNTNSNYNGYVYIPAIALPQNEGQTFTWSIWFNR